MRAKIQDTEFSEIHSHSLEQAIPSHRDLQRSPQVLRGVCDGDLVLDSRDWSIVEDASCLERLLKCNWAQSIMD